MSASPEKPQPQWDPWVGYGLMIGGAAFVIVGAAANRNRGVFVSFLVIGVAAIVAGFALWLTQYLRSRGKSPGGPVPAPAPAATQTLAAVAAIPGANPPLPSDTQSPPAFPPSSFMLPTPQPHPVEQPQPQPRPPMPMPTPMSMPPTPPPPPRRRRRKKVCWKDQHGGGEQEHIAVQKEFDGDASPRDLRACPEQGVRDHPPKPVPAVPRAQRKLALGYESASMPVPSTHANPPPAETRGPMWYTPPSRYPSVDDIAAQRQRFQARPETPAIDRQRRVGMLREAALMLGPPRDGSLVPMSGPATMAACAV